MPQSISWAAFDAASLTEGIVPGSAATLFTSGLMDEEGVISAESLPLPESLNGVRITIYG